MLGIEERFAIDERVLEANFKTLRERMHPDRHVRGTAAERRVAESFIADLNEAYATLKDPLRRAGCLLAMRGKDPFAEGGGAPMPVDFLERQIELRERLEEIEGSGDEQAAAAVADELDGEISDEMATLRRCIDGPVDPKKELSSEHVWEVSGEARLKGNYMMDTTEAEISPVFEDEQAGVPHMKAWEPDDVDAAVDAARRLKYLVNCREQLGKLVDRGD